MEGPTIDINLPPPSAALSLAKALSQARRTYLSEALTRVVSALGRQQVDMELSKYVRDDRLSMLLARGLPGEMVYPVPCILQSEPRLLAYYRLLLGYSAKKAYRQVPGFSVFQDMERKGTLTNEQRSLLPALCCTFAERCSELIDRLGMDQLNKELLDSLQLMTLGSSVQGRRNVEIGEAGAAEVKDLILAIIDGFIVKKGKQVITLINSAGREVTIRTGADPDITIKERIGLGQDRNTVSIEVKAGEDASNLYNRLGEAEKSHLKAKKKGFTEFWTIVNVVSLDESKARVQTPTTNRFYILSRLRGQSGAEYQDFRDRIVAYTGIRPSAWFSPNHP